MSTSNSLPVSITISRPRGGKNEDCIRVCLQDRTSGIHFVKALFPLAGFMEALTGLAEVRGTMEARGLENVGLRRIVENRSINCPLSGSSKREELERWLGENSQEEGWIISTYLGSQSSIVSNQGSKGCRLNYTVTKFVQP